MCDIKESQQTDRFSTHMREYFLNNTLPNDEIETLAVMRSALLYAIEEGILVRITKGKRLSPKPGETGVTITRSTTEAGARPSRHQSQSDPCSA